MYRRECQYGLPLENLEAFPEFERRLSVFREASEAQRASEGKRAKISSVVIVLFGVITGGGLLCATCGGYYLYGGLLAAGVGALVTGVAIVVRVRAHFSMKWLEDRARTFPQTLILNNEIHLFCLPYARLREQSMRELLELMTRECFIEFADLVLCVGIKQVQPMSTIKTRDFTFEGGSTGTVKVGGISQNDRQLLKLIAENVKFQYIKQHTKERINQYRLN